jgi:anti-sigma regulatory factor (Ser/Thr protein kinase)
VLSFDIDNDPALIPGLLSQLMGVVQRLGLFDDATIQRMGLALHEAMLNGIHHGNLELDSALRQGDEKAYHRLAALRRRLSRYRRRRLHIKARFDSTGAVFVIRDDGLGFNPTRIPDPTDDGCLERPSGRGLLLIRAFMDEVSFNSCGNQITLVKHRTTPDADGHR